MTDAKPKKLPIALYSGELPIGGIELDCAVLNDHTRILTAKSVFDVFERPRKGMNSRLEIGGVKLPPFIASKNLEEYMTPDFLNLAKPIKYKDGNNLKTGYDASLLTGMCEIYLLARREGKLISSQEKIAEQAEILLTSFAKVGIIALIDEAAGYQLDRKHDALRLLLAKYINEALQKWVLMFPDIFFAELDRLYNNEKTISQKRPQYYGKFINKYIYNPIYNGHFKKKLDELNITDEGKRKARFHQWLSSEGRSILTLQIGRIQGHMEICTDIKHFKDMSKKRKDIFKTPFLFEDMNKLV